MRALLPSSLAWLLLSSMLVAQNTSTSETTTATQPKAAGSRHRPTAADAATSAQLQELRDMLTAQQRQIQQLEQQLASRDQQIQQAQQAANEASAKATAAAARAAELASTNTESGTQVASLKETVSAVKVNDQNLAETIQSEQKRVNDEVLNPTAIHFKGITLSPTGSFLEFNSVWRDRGMGADINTQLTGAPFNGAPNANLSELNFTARHSRIILLAEGKMGNWTGRGYYEADWLGAGVTSNSNQSNSYVMRQRQLWGQAESASGWSIAGGQMWSLVTEYRTGLAPRSEIQPQVIDPQYTAGYSWARQPGIHIVKSGKKIFFGLGIENAQTLNLGGAATGTFTYQQAGNTGGLYNNGGNTAQQNYSYNWLPDFVGKVAFEPGYGHYEVFGILRGFRSRVFPNASAANVGTPASALGAYNDNTLGGGVGFNSRFAIVPKKLDLGFHILAGDGVGRYGDATLADVTTRANGTLAPIRGGSALAGLELHATPKLEIWSYYGGDYNQRQLYNATGSQGYGRLTANTTGCNVETIAAAGNNSPASSTTNPANCGPDIRDIQEFSAGWWYDFYRGSKGRFRQGFQYSYLMKQTWRGTGGSPDANTNMWFTSFRYFLP